jgi:hypothetical protein
MKISRCMFLANKKLHLMIRSFGLRADWQIRYQGRGSSGTESTPNSRPLGNSRRHLVDPDLPGGSHWQLSATPPQHIT